MDDFSLQGEELQAALDQIAQINQLLGGNQLTLHGIKKILKKCPKNQTITIADTVSYTHLDAADDQINV